VTEPARPTRRYDSPVRRQRTAETRDRILDAGKELLHESPVWNWRKLTVRAVADRAGVTERTVYRHFAAERDLRDAVLARLEDEAGVDLEGLRLEDVAAVTTRTFEYVSSFPLEPRTPSEATTAAASERLRSALLAAVAPATEDWPEGDRALAAATLDVLWSLASYERLVAGWGLDPHDAVKAVTWAIGLVEDAIHRGDRPTPSA
jgi:AcrR family transcriptional regulator